MDHEKFKNIAAGVQSIVVATALVVGGVWSALVLGDVARSRAELEKLRHSEVALEMSISATPLAATTGEQRELIIDVTVKNSGSKYVYIDLRRPVLQARRIIFTTEKGLQGIGHPIATHYYGPSVRPYSRLNVVPGTSRVLSFLIRVPAPGVYLLTFHSELPSELGRKLELLPAGAPRAVEPPGPATWLSQKIISVR